MSGIVLHQDQLNCVICLDVINTQTVNDQELPSELKCHHVFHKECITEWLKFKHNCPTCRAEVDSKGNECSLVAEMTPQEILTVPDLEEQSSAISYENALQMARDQVLHVRNIRKLNLNENTPVTETARKVHLVVGKLFKWS